MNRLIQQASLHLSARLVSVPLSFLLFAWIGRVLPAQEAAHAYFFSFALGFGLVTARICLQLGAGINGLARSAQRYREAQRGLRILRFLLPLLVVSIGIMTWVYTHQFQLVLASVVVAIMAAPDFDLIRSIVGRASLFSLAFAIGSLLALMLLQWGLPHTMTGVVLALLIQWVPVCLFNMLGLKYIFKGYDKISLGYSFAFGILALAAFDGLILNAPFLGWMQLSTSDSMDLALVIRVFVASLPLLPLLFHWMNSPAFSHLCHRWHLQPQTGFILSLLISGILAGGAFLFVFIEISHQHIGSDVFYLFILLLAAYSYYASQMRFTSSRLMTRQILRIIMPIALLYLGLLVALTRWNMLHPISLVVIQASALVGAGWLLARTGIYNNNGWIPDAPS